VHVNKLGYKGSRQLVGEEGIFFRAILSPFAKPRKARTRSPSVGIAFHAQ